MVRKIADSILQKLLRGFAEAFYQAIVDAINEVIRNFLKRLALALFGTSLAAFGILFLCFGFVKLLGLLLQEWLAWIVVGLLTILFGLVMLFLSMPRYRR